MKTDNITNTTINLPQFISKLRSQDELNKSLYKGLIIISFILIAAHIAYIAIAIYKNTPYTEWINYLGTLLSYSIFFFTSIKGREKLKNLDYSEPIYLVAKSMKKRYSLVNFEDLWGFIALIILSISLAYNSSLGFIFMQIMFWTGTFIGLIIACIYWCKEIKPLRDKASQLIKELEE